MNRSRSNYGILAAIFLSTAVASAVYGEDPPVTREEFSKMTQEMQDLRKEVAELKSERAAASGTATSLPAANTNSEVAELRSEVTALKQQRKEDQADADDRANEIEKIVKDALAVAQENSGGEEQLLITGDAGIGFSAQRGSPSNFEAGVAPRFLWKLNDHIMFDAALDIGIGRDGDGNNSTSVDLTIASATYILNDYLVVGGGLFVAPFAAYHRDFDPPWINKLPDDPLVFGDRSIAPGSVLGAFVSGAYPIGTTKINYAVYASNGPSLITNDPSAAGGLDLTNAQDLNNGKAVGGRIGFLPVPELEVGYSILYGDASPDGFPHTHALLQAVDLNYTRQVEFLAGNVSFHTEWVWSQVSDATFGPSANPSFDPTTFKNDRSGGYAMFSYRPTLASYKVLRDFEGVVRYDRIDASNKAPDGGHEERLELGLDYWFDARTVAKVAYEFDRVSNGPSSPAFMVQFGVGF